MCYLLVMCDWQFWFAEVYIGGLILGCSEEVNLRKSGETGRLD